MRNDLTSSRPRGLLSLLALLALSAGAAGATGGCGGDREVLTEIPVRPGWRTPIRRVWFYIVVHHSATDEGSAEAFDRGHRARGWRDGLGYHFVIGNGSGSGDGEVEIGGRWRRQITGAHARTDDGRYNRFGVGVCLVGHLDHSRPTPQQMASLRELVRFLQAEYRIPRGRILGHRDANPDRTCPGEMFPWRYFIAGTFAKPPARRLVRYLGPAERRSERRPVRPAERAPPRRYRDWR